MPQHALLALLLPLASATLIALFLRRAGKIRIGYPTDLSSILNPDPSSEGPRFNIFLARDCNQFAEYTDQVIFPKRGGESGKLNICLHELGTEIYLQHSD